MTKPIGAFLATTAMLGVVAVAFSAQAQAEYKLRWGHYLPDTEYVQVEKDFVEAVEERTDGRVEIETAYSGGLGQGNEIMTLAGRGAIDMASVVPGYYPDQLLFWKAYQIPFIFNSPREAMEISAEAYDALPVFQEELDKYNVKFLFHQPLGSYYLTGPDENCDTVEALQGKKLRTFGADIPKAMEAIGAVPVSVGVGEVYEALQRGTLDYSFLNPGNILSNRLQEVGTYSCGPVMSFAGHLIVIGKDSWDRLPQDIQQIMLEEADRAGRAYIDAIDRLEEESGAEIEAAGGVIKPFPEDELAKWKDMSPDLLQQWIDQMKERGEGERAEEVASFWRERIGGGT
jgi:TRAP-type C4-dicarboxylate transport system substrate-binding protein